MKASELRELSLEEIQIRIEELEEEGFNLRFQQTVGQLSNSARLGQVGRDIGQAHTVLREHELGLRKLASKEGEKVR